MSSKKSEFLKLFELRNWTKFLNSIVKAVNKSKRDVEELLDEVIEKLERIK